MTYPPNNPVRSRGWYDNCFEGAVDLPDAIRQASESICDRFTISGVCDPMYIANVTAFELGCGDGQGTFFLADHEAREEFDARLLRVVDRLSFAYSTCIQGAKQELRQLIVKALVPPA